MTIRNSFVLRNPSSLTLGLLVVATCLLPIFADEKPAAKEPEWKSLFDGKTLKNWKSTNFGGEGKVSVENGVLVLVQGSHAYLDEWGIS